VNDGGIKCMARKKSISMAEGLAVIWMIAAVIYCQVNMVIAVFNGAKESDTVIGFIVRTIIALVAYQVLAGILAIPGMAVLNWSDENK